MRDGEHPDGDTRAPADGGTLPGTGAAKPGLLETLPAASAEPAPAGPVIRPPPKADPVATSETLAAAPPAHEATLQGPYTVADLPSLPRVNDETYALGTEIARGGMGKILAARDRRLRREVVIKVMRRDFGRIDPRFEREALITARLQHPSIVRVYDAGVLGDGRAFYAMERVRGRSLELVLAEAKSLRERLALLPHAIAVCDALAYAHNEGIVHRDLKPSNVLLGPFGETVVIDWGLAKDLRAGDGEPGEDALRAAPIVDPDTSNASSEQLTQVGAVLGTPAFMAPEQARGEIADERTDVYALGALLYTLLSGDPPVSGTSADEVIEAVATGRRRRILEVEPTLPPELATIVERAMAQDRAARYASAKQLADDLRAFTAGKLVTSHEYTTWELVRRWVRRHRVPVAITLLGIVLLAALGVVSVRNIQAKRREAERQKGLAELAQFEAENKRDNLILGQASEVATTDPSYAAAWLKLLTTRALGWDRTATLAEQLRASGMAHVFAGHRQDVELVAASRDGKYVATGSDDSTVRLWNIETGGSLELSGHTGPIEAMTISSDSKLLATAGTDHKVILWTLADGLRRDLDAHTNTVRGVAFSPDNTKLASTGEEGALYLWDVATGKSEQVLQHTHSLRPMAWIDDAHLLVGTFDGRLGHIEFPANKVTWYKEHAAELRSIAVTQDHKWWVTTDEDGRVFVWDAATRKASPLQARHQDVAREAIITPDGESVVTAGGNNEVYVHSLPGGAYRALEGNEAGVKDIDVSPEGLVVSAGIDGIVRVWQLDGTLLHTWRGHAAAVKGCAFVGRHVVSGAEDHMVRVWNLDEPPPPPRGEPLRAWLDARTNLSGPTTASTSARPGE